LIYILKMISFSFFRDIARQERRRAENLKELQLQQELTREYKRAEAKDQMAVAATPQ
jgi:hypothetical protein